jgi:hypothetical protein
MPLGKRGKAILLEEIKHAHPIQLRDDTGVIAMVKVLVQVDTVAVIRRFLWSKTGNGRLTWSLWDRCAVVPPTL